MLRPSPRPASSSSPPRSDSNRPGTGLAQRPFTSKSPQDGHEHLIEVDAPGFQSEELAVAFDKAKATIPPIFMRPL
ncbi:MAG: hypothetical protein AAGA56_02110 [Myxococcota bacterium]